MKSFKKLKYEVIKSNKVKKYLTYAFGELFLIVVGILIALQINNYKERQKNVKLGEEIISELKSDLLNDLSKLDDFISRQQVTYSSQLLISKWLDNDENFIDSLSKHLAKAYVGIDYNINYSGYETLKKFGLKKIKDDSLSKSISNLYEVNYPYFIKFSEIYQKFLDNLLVRNPKHFNELNYMHSTMKPVDSKKLQKDSEYAYHFNSLKNFNNLLIYQGFTLRKEIEKTKNLIK